MPCARCRTHAYNQYAEDGTRRENRTRRRSIPRTKRADRLCNRIVRHHAQHSTREYSPVRQTILLNTQYTHTRKASRNRRMCRRQIGCDLANVYKLQKICCVAAMCAAISPSLSAIAIEYGTARMPLFFPSPFRSLCLNIIFFSAFISSCCKCKTKNKNKSQCFIDTTYARVYRGTFITLILRWNKMYDTLFVAQSSLLLRRRRRRSFCGVRCDAMIWWHLYAVMANE